MNDGNRDVVGELVKWSKDEKHKVDFIEMSNPSSGSVSNSGDRMQYRTGGGVLMKEM